MPKVLDALRIVKADEGVSEIDVWQRPWRLEGPSA